MGLNPGAGRPRQEAGTSTPAKVLIWVLKIWFGDDWFAKLLALMTAIRGAGKARSEVGVEKHTVH